MVEHVFHLHKNYLTCSGEMSVEGSNCGGRNTMLPFGFVPNDEKKIIERDKSIKLSKKDSTSPTSKICAFSSPREPTILTRCSRAERKNFLSSFLMSHQLCYQRGAQVRELHDDWRQTSATAVPADKTKPRVQKVRPEDQSPEVKVRFHVRKSY